MKVEFKQALRNTMKSKKTGMLLVLIMSVSMLILYLNISVTESIVANYEKLLRSVYGNVEISIMSDEVFQYSDVSIGNLKEEQVIRVFKSNVEFRGVDYSQEINQENAQNIIGGETIQCAARFVDIGECIRYGLVNLKHKSEEPIAYNSIIVSEKFAEEQNISLGDSVALVCNGVQNYFYVDGIAELTGIYSLEPESRNIFANYEYVHEIFNIDAQCESVTGLFVGFDEEQNLEEIYTQLLENNPDFVIQKNIDSKSLMESMNSFKQIMLFVFILSMLLNLFIVYSVLKLVILKRIPVIATYRSLGATKFFASKLIALENLMYVSVACVLNIILAPRFRSIVIKRYLGITNERISEVNICDNVLYLTVGFIFMSLIVLFITLLVTKRLRDETIRATLFDKPGTKLDVSFTNLVLGLVCIVVAFGILGINFSYDIACAIVGIVLFFVGVTLSVIPLYSLLVRGVKKICGDMFGPYIKYALNSISCDKNIAGIIQMSTITISFIFVIGVLLFSVSDMFTVVSKNCNVEYRISNIKSGYESILSELEEDVEGSYIDYYSDITIDGIGNAIVLGYNGDGSEWSKSIDIKVDQLNGSEIFVDEYFAVKNDLNIDEEIIIKDVRGSERQYKIAGFINSYKWNTARNVVVLSIDEYREHYDELPRTISFKTKDKNSIKEEAWEEIGSKYNVIVTDVQKAFEYQRQSISQLMNSILLLIAICLLLGVVGIVNHQLIAIWNRKQEIAIKYSVAMSKKNLITSLIIEQIIMYLLILAFSIFIGIGMLCFSKNVLFSAGLPMDVSVNTKTIAIIIITTIIIFGIGVFIPINGVRKTDIIQEIRAE